MFNLFKYVFCNFWILFVFINKIIVLLNCFNILIEFLLINDVFLILLIKFCIVNVLVFFLIDLKILYKNIWFVLFKFFVNLFKNVCVLEKVCGWNIVIIFLCGYFFCVVLIVVLIFFGWCV